MRRAKTILTLVVVLAMAFGTLTAFASEGNMTLSEKTDRFSLMENGQEGDSFSMISHDGELVINIHEDTPVIFEDDTDARERLVEGQTLAELLNDRMLVITYGITTRSLPPQTSPVNVVIMYEQAVALPIDVETPEQVITLPIEIEDVVLNGEIVVHGTIIEAAAPYISNGVVMVPLRAIAESLGYDVNWDNVTRSVRLGVATHLWIGRDEYHVGRMAPISLGTAPELTNNLTFVPLNFFRDVVTGQVVYVFEGQVVIETYSDMM